MRAHESIDDDEEKLALADQYPAPRPTIANAI